VFSRYSIRCGIRVGVFPLVLFLNCWFDLMLSIFEVIHNQGMLYMLWGWFQKVFSWFQSTWRRWISMKWVSFVFLWAVFWVSLVTLLISWIPTKTCTRGTGVGLKHPVIKGGMFRSRLLPHFSHGTIYSILVMHILQLNCISRQVLWFVATGG